MFKLIFCSSCWCDGLSYGLTWPRGPAWGPACVPWCGQAQADGGHMAAEHGRRATNTRPENWAIFTFVRRLRAHFSSNIRCEHKAHTDRQTHTHTHTHHTHTETDNTCTHTDRHLLIPRVNACSQWENIHSTYRLKKKHSDRYSVLPLATRKGCQVSEKQLALVSSL